MKPLIPARWAVPAGTALALAVGGIETYVALPAWARYTIVAVTTLAGVFGIEAPGSTSSTATPAKAPEWP